MKYNHKMDNNEQLIQNYNMACHILVDHRNLMPDVHKCHAEIDQLYNWLKLQKDN